MRSPLLILILILILILQSGCFAAGSIAGAQADRGDTGGLAGDALPGEAGAAAGPDADAGSRDGGLPAEDASAPDANALDSGGQDASASDANALDSGGRDASGQDASGQDASEDASGQDASDSPAAGNPSGGCAIPAEAQLEDVSNPTRVIGNGTAASCTSEAVVSAVALGGVITFDCGPSPVTITLDQTAKIVNDTGPRIVLDGGGKVTLSGGGRVRILYQNTCDAAQVWTTDHCQNQDHPQLTVQNLTFVEGNATGQSPYGGGAIFVRGGRFKIINSRFFRNTCDPTGPDVGGAAVRSLSHYRGVPAYVVNSTFGGAPGFGNVCSNGGGLSSIGVSYTVINSLFSYNEAIGNGANPARNGTPGGGSGGAIYNDGNTFTLDLCGTRITDNSANEGGGAIFFVSNDRTGSLVIRDSYLSRNPSAGFETSGFPGIFVLANGPPSVTNSTIE